LEPPKTYRFLLFLVVLTILSPFAVLGHAINFALEKTQDSEVVWFYLKLGVRHIVPLGADHILFVTSLCLLSTRVKTILLQATAFTVAHSVTLALSMKGILVAPGAIVEPIIALSIVFVAIENIFLHELKPWRIGIVFLFGLIHGLGFASALNEIGLPRNKFYTSILSFNAGVEIGQVIVIICVFAMIIIPFGKRKEYRKFVVCPVSIIIAIVASYWFMKRVFL
jgi:HupE / UreJ protein